MFDFLRPNKALKRQLELTEDIASTLSRINLQLGMIIENQKKPFERGVELLGNKPEVSLPDVVDNQGKAKSLPTLYPEPFMPSALLRQRLKGNRSKMLGESIVFALRRHGRSMESLADTYTGWSRQDLEAAVYELERMGLLENHVSATKVKGVSAMRRIYVATGKHYDWSKA